MRYGFPHVLALSSAMLAVTASFGGGVSPFSEEAGTRGLAMTSITFPPQNGFYGFGCGFADFDGDGDADVIVLTNDEFRVGIFENIGGGAFVDRTLSCNIPPLISLSSFATADYDGDGDLDLFLSRVLQPGKLFRNDGGFTFTDVSAAAGISVANRIGKGVCWGDYDNDGWVDLYVCNYRFVPGGPTGSDNQLYHNNGNGTFTEVAAAMGVNSNSPSLEAVWTDFDHDGDLDLYVSNDRGTTPGDPGNEFFRNDGLVFTEIASLNGTQVRLDSMGLACGDFNRDGTVDFYCANTTDKAHGPDTNFPLMLSSAKGNYVTSEDLWGVAHPGYTWGWGTVFFDWNNDGWLDLYVCNMFEPNVLYQNNGTPPAVDVTAAANIGGSPGYPAASYGAAVADVDGDGDLDVLMNDQSVPVTLHINNEGSKRSYLRFRVVGHGPNTNAIGAFAQVVAGSVTQIQEIYAGGNSYLGQNEQVLHFGLDQATQADSATIRWPSNGPVRTFTNIPANHTWTIYPPAKLGDADHDGDADASDRAALCSAIGAVVPGTEIFDFDGNFVIDHADVDAFRAKLVAGGAKWSDLDGDGTVNASDLAILLGAWGSTACSADLDGDGTVTAADLSMLLGDWG